MKLSTKRAGLALALTVPWIAAAAEAHPHLMSANPSPNGVAHGSPSVLRASFSEPLIVAFSGFQVRNAAGGVVPMGKATLDPRDHRTLVASVTRPLALGGYVVKWRAVSADTHRLAGSYAFRVVK